MIAIGKGHFLTGDCLELMKLIKDNSVDMILCDLPYGTTQNKWDTIIDFKLLWAEYWRICSRAIVLTAQTPFDKVLGHSQIKYLKYEWIWIKPNGTGFLNAKRMPLKNHENVLIFCKTAPVYNPQMRLGFKPYKVKQGRKSSNYGHYEPDHVTESNGERFPIATIEFNQETGLHPTQKPVPLFEYLIRTYTNENALILDNCAGSGTTAIAAENTNRRWICIEKDETYATKAIERIRAHVDSKRLPESSNPINP